MALLDVIRDMVSGTGEIAGLRITARYRPVGGPTSKVSPPRYKTDPGDGPYVVEDRYNHEGVPAPVVLLDSIQAQANRAERALLGLADTGRIELPWLQLETDVDGWHVRLTSLDAPHRSRDAYFRDSLLDGDDFEKSGIGRGLRRAEVHALRAYFEHSPADLVFGFWDSQRGGRQVRLARSYLSETIGWDPRTGVRAAGRFDPLVNMKADAFPVRREGGTWYPDEKGKTKLSEVNLGMVPPGPGPGGVSVRSIERVAYLNGIALARLGFAESAEEVPDVEVDIAARTTLAALAIVADRAAFAGPGVFFRSGCDLVYESEELAFVRRGGEESPVVIELDDALSTLHDALDLARVAGLAWRAGPLRLTPQPNLAQLIETAYLRAPSDES
ncbi:MAG: type I-G CRISPR-associated RAMP protein Csb1/Cas7g [Acidimicrobiales bacterium]